MHFFTKDLDIKPSANPPQNSNNEEKRDRSMNNVDYLRFHAIFENLEQ